MLHGGEISKRRRSWKGETQICEKKPNARGDTRYEIRREKALLFKRGEVRNAMKVTVNHMCWTR